MTQNLSNVSDSKIVATERTNVPGTFSPILEFQPEDGLGAVLRGLVDVGDRPGIPIFADLRNAAGDQLSTDTDIGLQYDRKGADDPTTVTEKKSNIRVYNTLDLRDQQNSEYIDQTKHKLKNTEEALNDGEMPKLGIRHVDRLFVSIECDEQIDWSTSALYIDGDAVRVV